MNARLARVALSTGAAALALGLVAPSVAFAEESGKGDPAGNNGTIKINPFGRTDGKANHPHPGCDFRLSMFGFDGGQTGTVTFVGQAPTKDAVTNKTPLGNSVKLAGATRDNKTDTFYDIRGAQLGLTGTPAKQGFHIKVLVDADNAPGGAKQKVFWLDCPAAAGGATSSTASTVTTSSVSEGAASGAVSETVSGVTSGAATAAAAGAATSTLTKGRVAGNARTSAATEFTGGSAAAAVGGATPAAAEQSQGGALPFTGIPLPVLLTLALGALGAGALAIRAGRRRTGALG